MEGSRRGVAWVATVLAGCALMLGASGCGGDDESSTAEPGTVQTASPERTFAPLLELAADEPWRPMSARWFVERSMMRYVGGDCGDSEVAVGHTMPERQNPVTDWIFPTGLGAQKSPAYNRVPDDANCEIDLDRRVFADQLVRPHDPGPRTPLGARRDEGFYLNLVDAARTGQQLGGGGAVVAPVYAERTDEGDGGVRLTYWMLFGMHGAPGQPDAHEGDWQRVDVLLRQVDDDDRYEPLGVQAVADGAAAHDTAWAATRRVDGTHPVVRLARATHDVALATGERCAACLSWTAWKSLADARAQPWYGFGGAWGDLGPTSATTGPLGPHDFFATDAEKQAEGAG